MTAHLWAVKITALIEFSNSADGIKTFPFVEDPTVPWAVPTAVQVGEGSAPPGGESSAWDTVGAHPGEGCRKDPGRAHSSVRKAEGVSIKAHRE